MGHDGGNRERGKWAELSYILEVKMTGLDNGLYMESRRNEEIRVISGFQT